MARFSTIYILALALIPAVLRSVAAEPAPQVVWQGEQQRSLTSQLDLAITPRSQPPGASDWFSRTETTSDSLGIQGERLHFRTTLVNTTADPATLWLQVNAPTLDSLYLKLDGREWLTGDHQPFDSRPIAHRSFVFPVSMAAGETVQVRGWTDGIRINLPVTLWQPDAFVEHDQFLTIRDAAFFGLMTTLVSYCLMLFAATRVRAYFAFALFGFSLSFFFIRLLGYGFQYLWPYHPSWNDPLSTLALYSVWLSFGWMSQEMLGRPGKPARLSRVMTWLLGLLLAGGAGLALFGSRSQLLLLPLYWALPALILVVAMLVLETRAGSHRAPLFAAAWSPMLLAGVWMTMSGLGYRTYSEQLVTFTLASLALTSILLSFIISLYIRQSILRRRALERETLELTTRQAENLEREVAERTAQLEDSNRQLNQLALTDPLTGLPNRRQLDDYGQLHHRLARQSGAPMHVAILDLDHFKSVNDNYGHDVGDLMLKGCGRVLNEKARAITYASMLAARLGGEELALVTYDLGENEMRQVLEDIRTAISELREPGAEAVRLTVSIGWARVDTREPLSQAFRLADAALYQAKSSGRNRIEAA